MATLVFIEAVPQPGKTEALVEFFKSNFHHSAGQDGFHHASAYVSEDQGTVVVTQLWESKADFEQYLGWRETAGGAADFQALIQDEPLVRFFDSR